MPARILSFREVAPKAGEYSLIVSALPGRGEQTIGVLLLDAASDTLHVRLRRDWERLASEEDLFHSDLPSRQNSPSTRTSRWRCSGLPG